MVGWGRHSPSVGGPLDPVPVGGHGVPGRLPDPPTLTEVRSNRRHRSLRLLGGKEGRLIAKGTQKNGDKPVAALTMVFREYSTRGRCRLQEAGLLVVTQRSVAYRAWLACSACPLVWGWYPDDRFILFHLPWMNSDIIHLLKQKEKSMKKYHEMKSHENKQLFTEIKNKCTLEIRKAKSKHYHSLIVGAASNLKNIWTTLNAVTRGTRDKKLT